MDLIVEERRCRPSAASKLRDGREVRAAATVVTTGTFLNGLIHCGEQQYTAGRCGEPASVLLGESLKRLGLRECRLKTGTPPRLDGRTIDWARFEEQPGDRRARRRSASARRLAKGGSAATADQLLHRVHDAGDAPTHPRQRPPFAMYSGQIEAIGPRYCPRSKTRLCASPRSRSTSSFLSPRA